MTLSTSWRGRWSQVGRHPAVQCSVPLAMLVIVTFVLWRLGEDTGSPQDALSTAFLDSQRYKLWLACISISVTAWILLFCWGIAVHRDDRTTPGQKAALNTWAAIVFVVVTGLLQLFLLTNLNPVKYDESPLAWWSGGRIVLTVIGLVAAIPWIAVLWRVEAWARKDTGVDQKVRNRQWQLIEFALSAVCAIILTATACAYMLRFALTAEAQRFAGSYVAASHYPSYAIVLYAALFTSVMVIAFLPVAITWHRTTPAWQAAHVI